MTRPPVTGESPSLLAAKVLTVSDGVVAGTREDRSGQALQDLLTAASSRRASATTSAPSLTTRR